MGDEPAEQDHGEEEYPCRIFIYRFKNSVDSHAYIGRTVNKVKRKWHHETDARRPQKQHLPLYAHMNKIGFDKWQLEELYSFVAEDRQEAAEAEDVAIDMFVGTLNVRRAYQSPEERKEYLKEKNEEWNQAHPAYKKEHADKYRASAHGKTVKLAAQNRYQDNPKSGGRLVRCSCNGKKYKFTRYREHKASIAHKEWEAAQVNQATLD